MSGAIVRSPDAPAAATAASHAATSRPVSHRARSSRSTSARRWTKARRRSAASPGSQARSHSARSPRRRAPGAVRRGGSAGASPRSERARSAPGPQAGSLRAARRGCAGGYPGGPRSPPSASRQRPTGSRSTAPPRSPARSCSAPTATTPRAAAPSMSPQRSAPPPSPRVREGTERSSCPGRRRRPRSGAKRLDASEHGATNSSRRRRGNAPGGTVSVGTCGDLQGRACGRHVPMMRSSQKSRTPGAGSYSGACVRAVGRPPVRRGASGDLTSDEQPPPRGRDGYVHRVRGPRCPGAPWQPSVERSNVAKRGLPRNAERNFDTGARSHVKW